MNIRTMSNLTQAKQEQVNDTFGASVFVFLNEMT